ncbi:Ada metal-binding domain-containing protein, partial [Mitsuokella jalaludinii]
PATQTVQTTAASVNTSSGKDNSADSTSSTVKKEAAVTSSSAAQTTSATSSAATSNASNTTSKAASGASAIPEASYLGNPNSKKFHRPTCRTIKHPENFVAISSRDEAIADGYTPCGVCKP